MEIKDVRDDLPSNGNYPKRPATDITHIDIHHSATDSGGYSILENIAEYHVRHNGWPGIGYHYVVAPDGTIYKTGYANEMRWSIGQNNSYTISIMLIGNFSKEDPALEQYDNAVKLAEQVANAYNVEKENILGHNEFDGHEGNTCPGINMTEFRRKIKLFN